MASERIALLVKMFAPATIVIKRARRTRMAYSSKERLLLTTIRRKASEYSIPVRFMGRLEVRDAFRGLVGETKYEIAVILAGIFPQLLWRLPPKRKTWQPERSGMTIFDAVSVGFAYWSLHERHGLPPE